MAENGREVNDEVGFEFIGNLICFYGEIVDVGIIGEPAE
jgi:hypothetical protein